MTETNNIKPLIQAMRRSLQRDHGLDVPYSALRASYLVAQGESPHATAKKRDKASKMDAPAAATLRPLSSYFVPLPAGWVVKTLYLAEDDLGCLGRLALDPEGNFPIQDTWRFSDGSSSAKVLSLSADVPSINRYGLPDYLGNTSEFFRRFEGMELCIGPRVHVHDLGDDSGDIASVRVAFAPEAWEELLLGGTYPATALYNAVGEWVGQHYKLHLRSMDWPKAMQFFDRYLSQTAQDPEMRLEWVWPDEDSDFRDCDVDMKTGALTIFGQPVPDFVQRLPRVRLCLHGGDHYEVVSKEDLGAGLWQLTPSALRSLKADLNLPN